jgi:tetratricopeptide (TPR) repeat protein
LEARLRLFLDVLSAVAHAHAHLTVHRDLKPSNMLVRSDGQVKLLDFGIAKLLDDEAHAAVITQLTQECGSALTPQYAAPEQLTGGNITTATDVYTLGVLLYVLLTGQHPAGPKRQSTAELVKAITTTEPRRMSEVVEGQSGETARLRSALRGDLDTIVAKALKKAPRERYSAVTAFAEDIERYLKHEPIAARPDTFTYRAAKFVRRNRMVVAFAALAFLMGIVGLAGTLLQARNARAQRDLALRELSVVGAVNDLNSFLLSDAAPSGKPFTVGDLLARAQHIVERQRSDDAARVELLISLGSQWISQDQHAKARPLMEEAYRISRGTTDHSARAKAACGLATALAHIGELPAAEPLFQDGLRELPMEPQYVPDRIFCLMRGRDVASQRGASDEAIARAEAAQQLVEHWPQRSEMLEFRASMDLAEAYRSAGRFSEAIPAFERASARLSSLGRDESETAGTLFNNWALALSQAGRPLEAEPIFRHAIDISRADKTDTAVSPMLLLNYGRTLRELGRPSEAAAYAERAYAKAKTDGVAVIIDQALLERARIYRDEHDLTRAEAMVDEVEPRLRHNLPPGHYAFAAVASERSQIALARGNVVEALRLANQAIAIIETALKAHSGAEAAMPTMFVRRSVVQLAAQHPREAAEDAARGLKLRQAISRPGTFSSDLGRAYLALGHALQAQGNDKEAKNAFRSAADNLSHTLGKDHPETVAVVRIAGPAAAQ